MSWYALALVTATAVFLSTASTIGQAEGGDAFREQAERGKLLYRIHCRSCHGEAATGDGPLARELTVRTPDLTTMARRNGGTFPRREARRTVDGRSEVRAHGRREMPVWGLSFQQSERDAAQEEEVRGRIDDLIAYLESLQRQGDK